MRVGFKSSGLRGLIGSIAEMAVGNVSWQKTFVWTPQCSIFWFDLDSGLGVFLARTPQKRPHWRVYLTELRARIYRDFLVWSGDVRGTNRYLVAPKSHIVTPGIPIMKLLTKSL